MARHRLARAAAGSAFAASVLAVPGAQAAPLADGGAVVMPTMSWITTGVRLTDDPDKAFVTGRYRCSKDGADTTMWISAKQGPGVGSAELSPESLAWYDAELRSFVADAGFTATCDRRWHDGRVAVEHKLGALQEGPALVQYCLHDEDEKPVNSPGYTANCTLESVPVR